MNTELNIAWQLVQNTGCNVFLTGKAGTGKTTFLRNFCKQTRKRNVVLAPTGIAAINAQGSTLHSFFQLSFGPYIPGTDLRTNEKNYKIKDSKKRIIRSLDLIIIDEISMVRADVLDCIDAVLRRYKDHLKPFGGVQLLLIGDLQQLAPVVKADEWNILKEYYPNPYFFSSKALQEAGYVALELKQVYRQTDQKFIDLLNKIRTNEADAQILFELNRRFIPGFVPQKEDGYIRLVTHNSQAEYINEKELDALPTESKTYLAEIWKDFPESSYPTQESLTLKVGAQVMFIKNDSGPKKQYYNGMLGEIVELKNSFVKVQTHDDHKLIEVMPETWENTKYSLNEESKAIEEELIGTFQQLPLKTAWAITVHKSQGLTFEHAIIDVQYSFSHGQTYVALSRCKNLEGMVLSAPIPPSAIIIDQSVVAYTKGIENQIPTKEKIRELEKSYYISMLSDAFTFHSISSALFSYIRHLEEWLYKHCGDDIARLKVAQSNFSQKVEKVSVQFSLQYQKLVNEDPGYANSKLIQERCEKAAVWFLAEIESLNRSLSVTNITTTNKMVGERLQALRRELDEQIHKKVHLLTFIKDQGFMIDAYLRERNLITLATDDNTSKKKSSKKASTKKKRISAAEAFQEVLNEMETYSCEDETEYMDFPDLSHDELPY